MLSKKIVKMVRRLFQMTQEDKLQWQETGHEGVFQLGVDDYIIRVAKEHSDEAGAKKKYVLSICNAKGVVLEQVSNDEIGEHIHDAGEFIEDLYHRARRIAMGVETAIDRITQRLEDEDASEPL